MLSLSAFHEGHERAMKQSFLIEALTRRLKGLPETQKRMIVAVAGPPGAGKSTVARALVERLDHAVVLPMDGFHLDNQTLQTRGLLARKGAPETFDTHGFHRLLKDVRDGGGVTVPTFDRKMDRVVPAGDKIADTDRIVIVEGNYLLLKDERWQELHPFWDFTIMIDVNPAELERRLIQRWVEHGLSHAAAVKRAQENDLRNAQLVQTQSVAADLVLPNG